jgi:hypothetical protein
VEEICYTELLWANGLPEINAGQNKISVMAFMVESLLTDIPKHKAKRAKLYRAVP